MRNCSLYSMWPNTKQKSATVIIPCIMRYKYNGNRIHPAKYRTVAWNKVEFASTLLIMNKELSLTDLKTRWHLKKEILIIRMTLIKRTLPVEFSFFNKNTFLIQDVSTSGAKIVGIGQFYPPPPPNQTRLDLQTAGTTLLVPWIVPQRDAPLSNIPSTHIYI